MKDRGIVVGTVTGHTKPGFLEFQFMVKRDYNNGNSSEGSNNWYKPIISYEVGGKVYEYHIKEAYRGCKDLDIGEKVQLSYDVDNPSKCGIIKEEHRSNR